jgi:geranylgeranyl reductase family protein
MTSTIAIVGAGPAGSAAAHRLAEAGEDVLLIDKATFPRDKFCGDGLTTLALRELDEMRFDPSTVPSWTPVHEAFIRSPGGRDHHIPLPDGPGLHAAIARRSELDHALVDFAVAAGARTLFGTGLQAIEPNAHSISLHLDDGTTIEAHSLIAADGMWSPIRKMHGLDSGTMASYRGEWHAFRQYFENVGPRASSELWVWFEDDILPGYAWSFPIGDGRANVGFGILRDGTIPTKDMKQLWPDLLSRPHIREVLGPDAVPESRHRAWPIPARVDAAPLIAPRTLFVGDAAAACDALTGEGIGQALLTGRQAAAALLTHPESFTTAAAAYEQEVRAELVADHRMATALGGLMKNTQVAEFALRAVGTNAWTRRNFGRWLFEDYPRALIATPRRWHRGMFTGPGAFATAD